eukprot:437090-Prymnesium_polylepis.1
MRSFTVSGDESSSAHTSSPHTRSAAFAAASRRCSAPSTGSESPSVSEAEEGRRWLVETLRNFFVGGVSACSDSASSRLRFSRAMIARASSRVRGSSSSLTLASSSLTLAASAALSGSSSDGLDSAWDCGCGVE